MHILKYEAQFVGPFAHGVHFDRKPMAMRRKQSMQIIVGEINIATKRPNRVRTLFMQSNALPLSHEPMTPFYYYYFLNKFQKYLIFI